jgi:bacterioferritin-associated ferredoxin
MTEKKISIEEIKAKIKVVCICKGIKQGRICDAIQKGADTIEKVNIQTGSGNGGCNATRCGPVIKKLLENKGKIILEPYETKVEDDDFGL